MIELKNYSKSYGRNEILKVDNLSLKKGVYWLGGVNGSGKSTLMKSLSALIAFKGEILIEGIKINKDPVKCRRLVNYAEAEPIFPSFLTGNELVHFFESCKYNSKLTEERETKDLVSLFQAGNFINDKVEIYSSGMLKKLSLILAFIGNPQWILLDEPFNALDSEASKALSSLIKNLYNSKGISFIFSSHQNFNTLQISDIFELKIDNNTVNIHAT